MKLTFDLCSTHKPNLYYFSRFSATIVKTTYANYDDDYNSKIIGFAHVNPSSGSINVGGEFTLMINIKIEANDHSLSILLVSKSL